MAKKRVPETTAVAAIALVMGSYVVPGTLAAAEEDNPTAPARASTRAGASVDAGWRLFQAKCATCHGPDATGTERGPNLLPRVQEMNQRRFGNLVVQRYEWTVQSGDAASARQAFIEDVLQRRQGDATMPAWESEPSVEANIADLYAYLRARANGTLGPGRPTQ